MSCFHQAIESFHILRMEEDMGCKPEPKIVRFLLRNELGRPMDKLGANIS